MNNHRRTRKPSRAAGLMGMAAFAALAAGASPWALADDLGWYGGANVGRSAATIDDGRITSGLAAGGLGTSSISNRDRSTGFKLYGGYQFNRNFALEGGYFDLGRFGYTANTVPAGTLDGNIKLKGFNLDAVGILPITDRLSALGRVGLNYAQARDSFSGTGAVSVTNPSPSKSGTNYKLGVGLQYAFTEALGMRAEVERYRVNDAIGNKGHVDLFSLGLVYRFGGKSQAPVQRTAAPAYVAAAPMPAPVVVAPPPPAAPPPPPPPTRVTFSSDSLFDFDKANLKPAGQQALDKFASDLKGVQYDTIMVTGHSDRIGSHDYNMKLSTRRAEAVKSYLVAAGIAAGTVAAKGVDGANPVTQPGQCKGSKPTPALIACLQPDRRVEVEVAGTR
ncbi:MAG: flagellar motor protein MotB [Polaromonas sp. 39-63-203]|nr:MAG: flagellar motor protein MotB [Polaromonas sp. 35-63-240]OZA96811.1 MAG: flagellar motor protein MotB [Polaromonas sp. 39-63-203]